MDWMVVSERVVNGSQISLMQISYAEYTVTVILNTLYWFNLGINQLLVFKDRKPKKVLVIRNNQLSDQHVYAPSIRL